ncbi:MAG: hypothetical protein ACLQVN_04995 [Bryobacteraceae bacterium]
MLCDCGHTFVPFTDGPTAVPDPECSAGGRFKHEKHGDGKSLVIAGYICGFAALVFLPPAFGLAAFVLGILNLTKGRVGHGVAHIVIAVTCGIAGMYIGAYIWQRNVLHLSSGGAVSSSQPAVAYEARGTAGRVSLTYTNASGGMEQQTVTLPWNKDFGVPRGTMLYLSAQNENERGTVTARIYVNGDVLQEAESSTPYGIASVSGTVNPDDTVFDQMTPAQHLSEAKSLELSNIRKAAHHLDAIPPSAAEYPEARALVSQFGDAYMRSVQADTRKSVAGMLEEKLQKTGYQVTVSEEQGELVVAGTSLSDAAARGRILSFIRSDLRGNLCSMGYRTVRMGNRSIALNCDSRPARGVQ